MGRGRKETEEETEERIQRGRVKRLERWRREVEFGSESGDVGRERWGGIAENHGDDGLELEELGDAEVVREEGEWAEEREWAGLSTTVAEGGEKVATVEEVAARGGEAQVGENGLGRAFGGWFGVFGRR